MNQCVVQPARFGIHIMLVYSCAFVIYIELHVRHAYSTTSRERKKLFFIFTPPFIYLRGAEVALSAIFIIVVIALLIGPIGISYFEVLHIYTIDKHMAFMLLLCGRRGCPCVLLTVLSWY